MKKIMLLIIVFCGCISANGQNNPQYNNRDTHSKWVSLFNGRTLEGWRAVKKDTLPGRSWYVDSRTIIFDPARGHGGDIVTRKEFRDFELSVDFKVSEGGNSGIKYFLIPNTSLGCEYQIIDDSKHPDAKLGIDGNRTTASLYDLIPAALNKPYKGAEVWNNARIIAVGNHVEHWLNGVKVLEYDRNSEEFKRHIALSKFKDTPGFSSATFSPILLQAHGDKIAYREIKIREL